MMDNLSKFASLFAGRADIYGADVGYCVHKPITREVLERHVEGKAPIGVYPLVHRHPHASKEGSFVHWGCTDIDKGYDRIDLARNLQKVMLKLGLHSHLEKSRAKGYHLWLLLPHHEWVPAETMRNALIAAHEIAYIPPVEVNPKSVNGGALGTGNFVRLPYAGWGMGGKQVMLDGHGAPMSFNLFLGIAEQTLASNNLVKLRRVAELARVAPDPTPLSIVPYSGSYKALLRRLPSGASVALFKDGPLPDPIKGKPDRSFGLVRLARDAKSARLSEGEALSLLGDAEARWGQGKFSRRPEGARPYLLDIIRKEYG